MNKSYGCVRVLDGIVTNAHNAHLLCADGPLVHYARRPLDALKPDDAGGTICNIQYCLGAPPGRPHDYMVQAIVVDDPVTCVICAVGYTVWP